MVIVGGGPTGINVAVEATKANLSYVIIEKGVLANSIYHFPVNMTFFSTSVNLEIADIPFISHSDKPTRKEALEYYRRIFDHYNLNIRFYEAVKEVINDGASFKVISDKMCYLAKNLVVCTGFFDKPRLLNIPGESLPKVRHYYDDVHPYVGQKVLVVGAANSACDVALETWQKGAEVTMAVREEHLYKKVKYWILPNIENRIEEGSITAHFQTELVEIKEDNVVLRNNEKTWEIENDFVLAMTGYHPDFELLDKLGVPLDTQDSSKPIHDPETLETSVPNLYVAGVINAGLLTSKLFIENTRDHGTKIISDILKKKT